MSDKALFILDNNKIKYINNNKLIELNDKDIDNLTAKDFLDYGNIIETNELDENINDKITILSTNHSLRLKMIQPIILYNLLDIQRIDINNVKKIVINDTGSVKYLFHNGTDFFSWYNNEWGKYTLLNIDNLCEQDAKNIITYGMSSNIINNLNSTQFQELWNINDSIKYINIIAVFNQKDFNDNFLLKQVEVIKDSFYKEIEVHDNLFREEHTPTDLLMKWNTTSTPKIKIIYSL